MTPSERKKVYRQLREVCPYGPHKRDWLHWWLKTYEGIHIPNVKVCADHDAPFTAFADAFFGESSKGAGNTSVFLILGSRLFAGKTFWDATLARARMILKGAEIFILGGSKDQTAQMREYIKGDGRHMQGLGWNHKRSPRHLVSDILTDTVKLHNGGKAVALAASEKATRSKHGTDLYVDELDEIEWDIFTSALGQTYQGRANINPLTVITSTWQNPDGSMTKAFDLAEEMDWGLYKWCWRETHEKHGGHVAQADVDRKQGEMTRQDWIIEVELERPNSGDLIFAQEVIDFLFDKAMGDFRDKVGHDYIIIPPAGAESFYTGADWAKQQDFTIFHTMIENPSGPDALAAWCMRQKEPWPVMFEHFNQRVRDYEGAAMFDGTGMAGDMIEDHLTIDAEPFEFSNRKRLHQIYSSYITAVEDGEMVYPIIPYLKKQHELLTRGQVYESTRTSKKNHTPDSFVAAALAREAQATGNFRFMMERAW